MAVSEMRKLSLILPKKQQDKLIRDLMKAGCVEIAPIDQDISDEKLTCPGNVSDQLNEATKEYALLCEAQSVLKPYRPAPKRLFPKKKRCTFSDYENEPIYEKMLALAQETKNLKQSGTKSTQDVLNEKARIDALLPWKNCSLPLDFEGTQTVSAALGTFPKTADIPKLCDTIGETYPCTEISLLNEDESYKYVCVFAKNDVYDEVERLLAKHRFLKADFPKGTADASLELANANENLAAYQKSADECDAKIKELALEADDLELAIDMASMQIEQCKAKQKLLETDKVVVLSGWVPLASQPVVEELLGDYVACYEFTEPKEGEDAPILLENPKIASDFEPVISMYSLPAYKTFDPTVVMSVFYFIIFGMMFGDAIYGLILILGGFLLPKLMDADGSTKKMMNMFGICGISCVIFGILFGSYAGNALQGVIKPIAFDIVEEPMSFLYLSLGIGGAHLLFAMGVRFWLLCKDGKVFDAIVDVGSWYLIFIGIGLFVLIGKIPGAIVAGVGVLMVILFSARDKKNTIVRFLLGLKGLYDIVNYVSDLLSYSRIMALGMASAIIAMVVNQMADLVKSNGGFGIVFYVLIMVLGHLINIALNLLGTFVHTSRLQYIEFFGKFYVDGGRQFRPLALNPQFTKLNQ